MRITAIESQKKNPQRVNVSLDGEFAFSLARIVAAWLKVGQELSEEKIATLQAEDKHEAAFQKSMHFLSFRPRSSAEIRQNLTKHGFAETLVEETIQRLQHDGLVDDAAFAKTWVENRNTFHQRSKVALRMELHRKGLPNEIVQSVLEKNVDEEALAFIAARKYARRLVNLDKPVFHQKLGGFLGRRGFSYSTIAPVISKVWKEFSRTDDDGETLDDKE